MSANLIELRAESVTKVFGRGAQPAVDTATVSVSPGDFTAIVGESGSGKSTLARMMLGLMRPTAGTVTFQGTDLYAMNRSQRLAFRRTVQCVLQDPSAAMNPRKTVRQAMLEVVRLHDPRASRAEALDRVRDALEEVELSPAGLFLERYPSQLSGGQRQRVLIARALVLKPKIIIADEAVSALDISVKAGVLELMERLRREHGIGYLFITHDLPVVKKVAQRVVVMRHGKVVEEASKKELFEAPETEYARELLAAAPAPDPRLAAEWIRSAKV